MPKETLQNSIIIASSHVLGEDVDVLPMRYVDAQSTKQWPTQVGDKQLPLLDWSRPYRRLRHSLRFACLAFWAEGEVKAALRIGITKPGDRISITHLSRDISYTPLAGKMTEVAYGGLQIAQVEIGKVNGFPPEIGVLNPAPSAIPHYESVARRMNLEPELKMLGRRDKLMYLR